MQTLYNLNIAPVLFEDAEVNVELFPYKAESLQQFRTTHSRTHYFRRHGAKQIISVPVIAGAPAVGGKEETVHLSDHLPLCADLARNSLLNALNRTGRQSDGYIPLRVLGPLKEDLLRAAIPENMDQPDWISVRTLYELHVRVYHFERRAAFIGLVPNLWTTNRITLNCHDLWQKDFLLDGLYVGRLMQARDARLTAKFQLVGRVSTVEEREGRIVLLLEDRRQDVPFIDATDAYLNANLRAMDRCLQLIFRHNAERIKNDLEIQRAELLNGLERLRKLRGIAHHLNGHDLEIVPGVPFSFSRLMDQRASDFPAIAVAPPTTYIFDPRAQRTSQAHNAGLRKHGPYSAQTFTPTAPRLCVICQKTDKGRIEQFVNKLLRGVTLPDKEMQPFDKGLIRLYHLEDAIPEFFTAESDSANAYLRAARSALSKGAFGPEAYGLALVQTDDRFRSRLHAENPYLVTKALFLASNIPTQEFRTQTATAPPTSQAYALNSMALASYAKLGGTPWLIQADPPVAHEFVIGLGSAYAGEGRLGKRDRLVGITTVFSGDGRYRLSSVSRAVPMSEYRATLLESLRETIDRVRGDMNWRPHETVRLIFHAFKPMKDLEVSAVNQLMEDLGDFNLEHAFLHIAHTHPLLLIDEQQKGKFDPLYRQVKGQYAPTRGHFVHLSPWQTLLVLTGAAELKRPTDGLPRPVMINLHRSSNFFDMTYLTRQVFHFSNHSWRSFHPGSMPVTISYSQQIAQLLGKLSATTGWSPDVLWNRIGSTRWFL